MKIAGLWSGHDCSFCVLEDGVPVIHAELERYIREKEPKGDSPGFLLDVLGEPEDIEELASCFPRFLVERTPTDFLAGRSIQWLGHHCAHAAHAFYSSRHEKALVFTLDGGGVETQEGAESATSCWFGDGTTLKPLKIWPSHEINIGGLWTRVTRYIFRLQNGWPRGHQAGSVMAMAAMGDREKYYDDFCKMLTTDILPASVKPRDQPVGAYTGNDPRHDYLGKYTDIADSSDQAKYDLAASLQAATEDMIKAIIAAGLKAHPDIKHICVAGGVALNSVAMGKAFDWFPELEDVFIPPVPYDGGLSIGAAQYTYHAIENNPRVQWDANMSPYLGEEYTPEHQHSEIIKYVDAEKVEILIATEDKVVDLLIDQKIIAIFCGRSESGRRALGNRSIIADPRSPDMKDLINQKVKHRQWYRPFAPSIMLEHVVDWFEKDIESPYMSHVIKFKEEVRDRVPAVVHFDGTARLQTVTETDNPAYYSLLSAFNDKTGVPLLLNTSFNDREPICETVEHAIDCYLRTEIDHLWFPELGILVTKRNDNA
jgi:carbamoyltransferase